jgi:hypothetical protein
MIQSCIVILRTRDEWEIYERKYEIAKNKLYERIPFETFSNVSELVDSI